MPKKWQFVCTEYFTGLIFHGKFPAECVTVNQVSDPGGVDLDPAIREKNRTNIISEYTSDINAFL